MVKSTHISETKVNLAQNISGYSTLLRTTEDRLVEQTKTAKVIILYEKTETLPL